MERSSKHSPRIDDQMSHDVEALVRGHAGESHTQESRLQEGGIDGEQAIDMGHRPLDPDPAGASVSGEAADQRADVARHLAAATWPATADHLVRVALDDEASAAVVSLLGTLPRDGARYANVQEVWSAAGGAVEGRT